VYLGLAWHFWDTRWRRRTPATGLRPWERGAILVALGIHGALLYSQIFAAAELRFGFAQALSVMMGLAVLICWIEGIFYRIELVYPMALAAAALCAPLPAFFSGRASPDPVSFEFRLHLFFGMLAYSLFVVATFACTPRAQRHRAAHGWRGRCAMCRHCSPWSASCFV